MVDSFTIGMSRARSSQERLQRRSVSAIWLATAIHFNCVCMRCKFDLDHTLICKYGGYPTLQHNEIRDITASLLKEICQNVTTEARLQPVTGEVLGRSANTDDEARVDIRARNFWS